MTRDEYIQVLASFTSMDIVKAFNSESPIEYTYELYVNTETKDRTQIVDVSLLETDYVIATSMIGECPLDTNILINLLEENQDGCYSRVCALNGSLFQIFKYPLDELEEIEMLKGIDEVSRYADFYEEKYFGGIDNG